MMSDLLDKALAAREANPNIDGVLYRHAFGAVATPQAVIDLYNEAIEAAQNELPEGRTDLHERLERLKR